MKKLFLSITMIIISLFMSNLQTHATIIQGGINTNEQLKSICTVLDKNTGKPIPNAIVKIPAKNFSIYTDTNGHFTLKPYINSDTILYVYKENYKPYSITITKDANLRPLTIALEIAAPFDISLEAELCHLGDNNFSGLSANAGQFKGKAVGPVYNKALVISQCGQNQQPFLVIGSIIGIDTALARGMGQNSITNAFASPPSVYLNGHKIAEIKINGDNQRIRLPKALIKFNQKNIITIKAGKNLMQTAYIDYDDIEFMNLSVQTLN